MTTKTPTNGREGGRDSGEGEGHSYCSCCSSITEQEESEEDVLDGMKSAII